MTTPITKERLTKILIETMALIKERSSRTGNSSGISTEVNAELFAEVTRVALAAMGAEPVAWVCAHSDEIEYNGHNQFSGGRQGLPLYAAPPARVVPDEMPVHTGPREFGRPQAYVDGWNACRAAMLQCSEQPQNVQQNIPEIIPATQFKPVADLYALCWQPGDVVTYTPEPEKAAIWLNNYSGTCVKEYVKLERLQNALTGNYPVIPDGWVKCSERMPKDAQWCAVNTEYGYYVQCWSDGQGWLGDEISIPDCDVTHWMPLPAAPQQEG